jgi:nucleoid-associated protein YgaU
MSPVRLTTTAAAMALIGIALAALTPNSSEMTAALAAPQRTADTAGPDVLVLSAAGLLAWAVWTWGAVGLTLTASTALPGALGGLAGLLVRVVLPAGARRSAALALGVGLSVSAPLLLPVTGVSVLPTAFAAEFVPDRPSVAAASATAAPDWPSSGSGSTAAVPDWPAGPDVAGAHVVVRGDCLWHIAADRLLAQLGRPPDDGEVAAAVRAWWHANADVIGPDPDLLLPGQILRPPDER